MQTHLGLYLCKDKVYVSCREVFAEQFAVSTKLTEPCAVHLVNMLQQSTEVSLSSSSLVSADLASISDSIDAQKNDAGQIPIKTDEVIEFGNRHNARFVLRPARNSRPGIVSQQEGQNINSQKSHLSDAKRDKAGKYLLQFLCTEAPIRSTQA